MRGVDTIVCDLDIICRDMGDVCKGNVPDVDVT